MDVKDNSQQGAFKLNMIWNCITRALTHEDKLVTCSTHLLRECGDGRRGLAWREFTRGTIRTG